MGKHDEFSNFDRLMTHFQERSISSQEYVATESTYSEAWSNLGWVDEDARLWMDIQPRGGRKPGDQYARVLAVNTGLIWINSESQQRVILIQTGSSHKYMRDSIRSKLSEDSLEISVPAALLDFWATHEFPLRLERIWISQLAVAQKIYQSVDLEDENHLIPQPFWNTLLELIDLTMLYTVWEQWFDRKIKGGSLHHRAESREMVSAKLWGYIYSGQLNKETAS